MGRKDNKKDSKNYIIYTLVVIITIALLLYFRTWYRAYVAHQLTIPIIDGYLSEIKYDELDNYILENPDFTLYICTSDEEKCRTFEKKFRKTITKYNLKDQIIYLNLNDYIKNSDNTLLNVNFGITEVMKPNEFFSSYPSISIFKDKKLYDVLIINNSVTMDKVNQFLEENEIIIKH